MRVCRLIYILIQNNDDAFIADLKELDLTGNLISEWKVHANAIEIHFVSRTRK